MKVCVIRREGGSRILTVTNIFPKDWEVVTVIRIKSIKNTIAVIFEKVK